MSNSIYIQDQQLSITYLQTKSTPRPGSFHLLKSAFGMHHKWGCLHSCLLYYPTKENDEKINTKLKTLSACTCCRPK